MSNTRRNLEKQVKHTIWQEVVFSWRNAVILGATLILGATASIFNSLAGGMIFLLGLGGWITPRFD